MTMQIDYEGFYRDCAEIFNAIEEPEELPEDYMIHDHAGGNIDDAYEIGSARGYEEGRYSVRAEINQVLLKNMHSI